MKALEKDARANNVEGMSLDSVEVCRDVSWQIQTMSAVHIQELAERNPCTLRHVHESPASRLPVVESPNLG